MADHVVLGIHGISVPPGDHICGLYFGNEELDAIMLPFIEAELRAGDKCICVFDGVEPTDGSKRKTPARPAQSRRSPAAHYLAWHQRSPNAAHSARGLVPQALPHDPATT